MLPNAFDKSNVVTDDISPSSVLVTRRPTASKTASSPQCCVAACRHVGLKIEDDVRISRKMGADLFSNIFESVLSSEIVRLLKRTSGLLDLGMGAIHAASQLSGNTPDLRPG